MVMLTCFSVRAQDELPVFDNDIEQPIHVAASAEHYWDNGGEFTVRSFRGGAVLTQGHLTLTGQNIVLIEEKKSDGVTDVRVFVEDSRANPGMLEHLGQRSYFPTRTLRLQSTQTVTSAAESQRKVSKPDEVIQRAASAIFPGRRGDQDAVRVSVAQDPLVLPGPGTNTPIRSTPSRRIQIRPRSNQPFEAQAVESNSVPPENVYVITGGVNVLSEGIENIFGQAVHTVVDLSADRVVIWMEKKPSESGDINTGLPLLQAADTRFQVYLEGNILVRHSQGTLDATHAFYDAETGQILAMNADLRAVVTPNGQQVRIHAEKLRQLATNRFHAQNAWTTTSPYGKPGYRLQSQNIFVNPGPPRSDGSAPLWVTAENSQLIIGDIPLLTVPKISVPAEDPGIPIRRASVSQDRIFGFQIDTAWDMTKITSVEVPQGTEWDLLAHYYSQRGPGVGTQWTYDFLNRMGQVTGEGRVIYQYDNGNDNLSLDRRSLTPKDENRGQVILRHRQRSANGVTLFGEIGFVSDRNYLEQYFETEFDEGKDAETLAGIRQDQGAWSGSLLVQPQVNDFETTTEWLPRGDLHGFSVPLLNSSVYWSSHTSAAYAHLSPTELPTDPADPFSPALLGTPYIRNARGVVAMTRHRLDAPFMLGPVNISPWVMGEAAFWEEGLVSNDVGRLIGNAGVRATLTATKVMPFVRSSLFNLNGLAHKSEKSVEYSFTDSSQDLSQIAQYNTFDENAQERFRNRIVLQIYPGLVPPEFNPRFYAIRNGAGLWTSAPYHELVDDQQVVRFRWRNRLQTKVGPVHNPRTRDWMIWETGVSLFPDPNRDNFGEDFGLLYGNYRWNLNDRTSFLADGTWDFFSNRQNYWNVGILSQRSTRGSVYVAYRHVEARNFLDSEILTASYSYQLSPKWISTAAVSYDVGESESRGSSVTLSRVGLDFVCHVGFGVDTSKNNVGVAFAIEPRFGPPSPTNLGYLLGLQTQ